ncbi:hypothetical protein [Aeromicrobium sp. CF3.5]|uniref:hypothetical protein n=1 Tax=Aeromicrobium sp. CF3.5 TaxID=3373078 RepID=UPI003EE53CCB
MLDRQFTGRARDELITLRVELDRRLRRDLARAAEAGATQIHALVDPIAGLPISATLVVAQLFTGPDGAIDAQVRSLLGAAEENAPTPTDVPVPRRCEPGRYRGGASVATCIGVPSPRCSQPLPTATG